MNKKILKLKQKTILLIIIILFFIYNTKKKVELMSYSHLNYPSINDDQKAKPTKLNWNSLSFA